LAVSLLPSLPFGFVRRGHFWLGVGAVLSAVFSNGVTSAAPKPKKPVPRAPTKSKKHAAGRQPVFPADADQSKAFAAAQLGPGECLGELDRRGIHFRKAEPATGVLIPVRLAGPVDGVLYRTDYPDSQRDKVPFEVFDCRLVVALSDLSAILRTHDIDEVRLFSAWRPPPKLRKGDTPATAHEGALAADLRLFKKSSGESLDVEADFHGKIGAEPCGAKASPPSPDTPAARELHSIYCAMADARLFHVLLSPDHDYPHRNHFHVEVRPGVRWFIVR
jgi:hypothetical protein